MSQKPDIALVAAIAENGVIGSDGGMPWRLSSDLKRFKRDTMGKPVIMGRKTWEAIGRPLPGRANIVVTRQVDYVADGVKTATDLEAAIDLATEWIAKSDGAPEICIIGGGELYAQALPKATRLYITHVLAKPEGDTHFPKIRAAEWRPVHREALPAGENDSAATIYVVYERKPV